MGTPMGAHENKTSIIYSTDALTHGGRASRSARIRTKCAHVMALHRGGVARSRSSRARALCLSIGHAMRFTCMHTRPRPRRHAYPPTRAGSRGHLAAGILGRRGGVEIRRRRVASHAHPAGAVCRLPAGTRPPAAAPRALAGGTSNSRDTLRCGRGSLCQLAD